MPFFTLFFMHCDNFNCWHLPLSTRTMIYFFLNPSSPFLPSQLSGEMFSLAWNVLFGAIVGKAEELVLQNEKKLYQSTSVCLIWNRLRIWNKWNGTVVRKRLWMPWPQNTCTLDVDRFTWEKGKIWDGISFAWFMVVIAATTLNFLLYWQVDLLILMVTLNYLKH